MGTCKKGDNCNFSHEGMSDTNGNQGFNSYSGGGAGADGVPQSVSFDISPPKNPGGQKTFKSKGGDERNICKEFIAGTCTDESQCPNKKRHQFSTKNNIELKGVLNTAASGNQAPIYSTCIFQQMIIATATDGNIYVINPADQTTTVGFDAATHGRGTVARCFDAYPSILFVGTTK